jgi:hypothetical protein
MAQVIEQTALPVQHQDLFSVGGFRILTHQAAPRCLQKVSASPGQAKVIWIKPENTSGATPDQLESLPD